MLLCSPPFGLAAGDAPATKQQRRHPSLVRLDAVMLMSYSSPSKLQRISSSRINQRDQDPMMSR
jgi:hypothetical protein